MSKKTIALIFSFTLVASATAVFAQTPKREKPAECEGKLTMRGKFKTLTVASAARSSLQIDIRVEPKHQTDGNYLAIANQIRAKYCKEGKIYLAIFDSEQHYKLNSVPQPDRPIDGTPRALYVLDRSIGREVFEIYRIVDGRIETREFTIRSGQ